MSEHNDIREELRDMNSPLADMRRNMPYAVPQGYFVQLPEHALATVAAGDNELTIKHDAPYRVPDGYFEQLPATLLALVKKEEESERKKSIYVPRLQWLNAAMLAVIISFGGYIMFSANNNNPEQMLSSIPRAELKSYVQTRYAMDVNEVLREGNINDLNIESKDIVAYLDETGWE